MQEVVTKRTRLLHGRALPSIAPGRRVIRGDAGAAVGRHFAGGQRLGRLVRRWREAELLLFALMGAGVVLAVTSHATDADLKLYQHYAKVALSAPLLHSLPREYPALSLAIFLVPEMLSSAYPFVFALLAAAAGLALVLSSDGLERFAGWPRRTAIYLLAGTLVVVFARYDVFAALAAFLAVEGARRGRWGRAWLWAVVGGLLKLFPFLLLPGFLLVERAQTGKWAVRRAIGACVPLALVLVVQAIVAPGSALEPVRYELRRGFELSSVQGSLTFLTEPFDGHWVKGFGAVEVVGHGRVVIGAIVLGFAVVALAALWWLSVRGRLSVEAVSLAVLSVSVLADKAFAAQYLIWVIPLWAYWPLRRGWIFTALLTTAVYPVLYDEAHVLGPNFYLATAMGVVRNVVFIAATAGWLAEQLKMRQVPKDGPGTGPQLEPRPFGEPPVALAR